ncbi:MAG: transglycosylase domain-containing protein [Balneolaceae bacterium]
MSDDIHNVDMDRYFNDPEYRQEILKKKRERESVQPQPKKSKRLFKRKTWLYGLGTLLFLMLVFAGYVFFLFQGLPSLQELENPRTAVASEVLSRDGAVLDRYYVENRTYVSIDRISPNIVNALVATEDHRFFDHWGIDSKRLASLPYYWIQSRFQGGSTISQQLARNLYISIGFDVSVNRKLREMITAVQIEQNYTKREIIEMYLNTVQFSNSAYGIESATRTHFNKSANDVSITEAATLVGMLRAVTAYNPRLYPERALLRRNVVLRLMQQHGFISAETFQNLRLEEIVLDYQPPSRTGRESRYFGEYVRQRVQEWTAENGYDLYSDGLTIHTTIDSRLQRHAERAVAEKIDSLQSIFEREWTSSGGDYMDKLWEQHPNFLREFIRETNRYKNGFARFNTDQESVVFDSLFADEAYVDSVKRVKTRLQTGFVAIDPANGSVLAWVGGANYGSRQYDHVHQSKRQAGSTFKPFVYAVAIDNGYMPYHTFSKYPTSFIESDGRRWNPKDPTVPSGPEMVPLRQGLARSLNNVTVRLLPEIAGNPGTNRVQDLVPAAQKIKEMASNLGIDMSLTPAYPSIALGTAEVSLLELVSAYTTFANEGVHIEPIAITRIEDKEGNILVEYRPEYRQESISPETAYIMLDMMRGVISGGDWGFGTGVRLRNTYNVQQDVAGKTGTTQNSADNWFVAMMPHIVMGSWVGGEDRKIRFPTDNPNSIGQGARSALPIVGTFINNVTSDPEAPWSKNAFTPPPGFIMPEAPETSNESDRRGRIGW